MPDRPGSIPALALPARSRGRAGDLLAARGMDAGVARAILRRAHELATHPTSGSPSSQPSHRPLAERIIANVFLEDSTRTRLSFSIAAARLGAHAFDLTSAGSSVRKGEDLPDTVRTIDAMGVDAIVIRAPGPGSALVASRHARCPVINAGDGAHEHPTQALLDCLALAEASGRAPGFDFSSMRVVIAGDIASSRVARSNIALMTTLGAKVVCVGPPALLPESMASLGCEISRDLDAAIEHASAVMMLRIQFERHDGAPGSGPPKIPSQREYRAAYALTTERAQRLSKDAWIMHPGPMNRGLEIDASVADSPRSLISAQVEAGVRVRMAVLERAIAASENQPKAGEIAP